MMRAENQQKPFPTRETARGRRCVPTRAATTENPVSKHGLEYREDPTAAAEPARRVMFALVGSRVIQRR